MILFSFDINKVTWNQIPIEPLIYSCSCKQILYLKTEHVPESLSQMNKCNWRIAGILQIQKH